MYNVKLILENNKTVFWQGEADDTEHALGLAIAWATELHGEQVFSCWLDTETEIENE